MVSQDAHNYQEKNYNLNQPLKKISTSLKPLFTDYANEFIKIQI